MRDPVEEYTNYIIKEMLIGMGFSDSEIMEKTIFSSEEIKEIRKELENEL